MKPINLLAVLLLTPLSLLHAGGMSDDPLLFKVTIDQLEWRDTDDNTTQMFWEGEAWLGKDLNKLWLKTEGESVDGKTEEGELQLLYSRAVAPYWDLQVGWRHDYLPEPDRDWLAVGIQGTAPWFIETDLALFVGEEGRTALRLGLEYELMLTQHWVLTPELEANFYGKADDEREQGSGLSDTSVGLRLAYEFRREIAPYVGVNWTKLYGGTADHAREGGEKTDQLQWVAGIRIWF